MAARNALEVSFRVTHTVPGQQIRHWPSLDLLISVTYKLEDCLACLRYIEWALKVNTYSDLLNKRAHPNKRAGRDIFFVYYMKK